MKIGWIVFFSLLAGFAVWLFMEYVYLPSKTVTIKTRKNFKLALFRLPNDHNPDVFGAPFWESFHTLSNMIPCPTCRNKAVPFMIFFHDIVNKKTGKKIYDPQNFNYWIEHIKKIDTKK